MIRTKGDMPPTVIVDLGGGGKENRNLGCASLNKPQSSITTLVLQPQNTFMKDALGHRAVRRGTGVRQITTGFAADLRVLKREGPFLFWEEKKRINTKFKMLK